MTNDVPDTTRELRRIAQEADRLLAEGEYAAVLRLERGRQHLRGPFSDEDFALNDRINHTVVKAGGGLEAVRDLLASVEQED